MVSCLAFCKSLINTDFSTVSARSGLLWCEENKWCCAPAIHVHFILFWKIVPYNLGSPWKLTCAQVKPLLCIVNTYTTCKCYNFVYYSVISVLDKIMHNCIMVWLDQIQWATPCARCFWAHKWSLAPWVSGSPVRRNLILTIAFSLSTIKLLF